MPQPFKNRSFCNRLIWKVLEDKKGYIVASSPEAPKKETTDTSVRGMSKYALKLTKVDSFRSDDEVEAELVLQLVVDANLPKLVVEHSVVNNLRQITYAQQYFQQLRELQDYDNKDGISIGEMFMLKEHSRKDNAKGRKKKRQVSGFQYIFNNTI